MLSHLSYKQMTRFMPQHTGIQVPYHRYIYKLLLKSLNGYTVQQVANVEFEEFW